MINAIKYFNGKNYEITVNKEVSPWRIMVSNGALPTVYESENGKVVYAPYQDGDVNAWIIVFKNNVHISKGSDLMTQESFEEDYMCKAFATPYAVLLQLSLLIIEAASIALYIIYGISWIPQTLVVGIMSMYMLTYNNSPVGTKKERKKLIFTNYFFALLLIAAWIIFMFISKQPA